MRKWLALSAALFIAGPPCLAQAPNVRAVIFPPQAPTVAAGGGNVTPDQVGAISGAPVYQATSNNFNKTPINITAGLTNPGLVCTLTRADGANDVTAAVALTWNGVSMALRVMQATAGTTNAVFLFGLRNPASGAQTLNVSATNTARDNFVNCASFSNVNQTSDALAFPNPTSTISVNNIAVTSAAGHIAIGVGNGSAGPTILGTTIINDSASGALVNAMADYVVSVGASTTVGTTATLQTIIAGMDVSN